MERTNTLCGHNTESGYVTAGSTCVYSYDSFSIITTLREEKIMK
jgi:hypothetical protein